MSAYRATRRAVEEALLEPRFDTVSELHITRSMTNSALKQTNEVSRPP